MKLKILMKKLNIIRAAVLVVLAAALCLAGCSTGQGNAGQGSTGQDAAGTQGSPAAQSGSSSAGLRPEDMARLC